MTISIFKRLCFAAFLSGFWTHIIGQTTLNSAGNTMSNATLNVDFSIGETMAVPSDPKAILTHASGVIQPLYVFSTETNEAFDRQFKFSVFPNPTTEGVSIETDFKGFETLEIFAVNGALLRSVPFDYSIISFRDYPNGTYLLVLRGANKTVSKSTKIIKQ